MAPPPGSLGQRIRRGGLIEREHLAAHTERHFIFMRVPKRKSEEDRRALQNNGPVYLTREGIEKIHRTIKRIKADLPEAIAELQRTREMGDLSENAAYQQAKHQVRKMQTRLLVLTERLKNVIEIEIGGSDTVQLGSTVLVACDGAEREYQLVGPMETDPLKGRISHESPLGQVLIGTKKGDTVTFASPAGPKEYTIKEIS